MRTRHLTVFGLLAIVAITASMLPITNPEPVLADPGVLRWTRIDTPGAVPGKNDIVSPSEVNRIAIGSDGKTFYAVDIPNSDNTTGNKALYKSTDSGVSWSDELSNHLYQAMTPAEQGNFRVWNIAIAPDDVNFVAVVTNNSTNYLPRNVWVSTNGGVEWENSSCPATDNISVIDVSMSYGSHDIAIGTRTGGGGGTIWVLKATDHTNWIAQGLTGDIMALKFSPSYVSDATIAIVYSNATGTYLNAGVHDLDANTTDWTAIYGASLPEITTAATGTSPTTAQIITADLELPSDFSGQALSLRRYYISTDDAGATGNAGIYRFDDTVGYWLMPATTTKRISSIAYHGTYASGKLLAGEVLGDPCSATVITWFTDVPITCPIPCWYRAPKPPTGAAGTDNCTGSGYGNAQVAWSSDGSVAYVATASSAALVAGANWPNPYLTGEDLDESAFSLSYNNGETWNQLALIDTKISQLTDIAPAPDCSNVYLASSNNGTGCSGFDSVWRSQSSPIGFIWERVLCLATTDQACATGQTDTAILRLAGDKADGQIAFWAATGTRKVMWSPDFGDYWINITPRFNVQDVAAEDSNTLYILSATGWVQKLTYSGTGWVSDSSLPTGLNTGYSIATAYTGLTPDNDKGHIIVGGTGTGNSDVAYSTNGGAIFTPITTLLPSRGNTLVVAHSGYKSNGEIFAINPGGMYEWSTYYGGGAWAWPQPREGEWSQQGWGSHTGLAISRNGSFYFSALSWSTWTIVPYVRWSEATAGLDPTTNLGTQPTTRLRICGSLESGEPITMWFIDQRPYNPPAGGVWCYLDTLSWVGPVPTSPVSQALVDCDPVTGRASEINLKWQPRSLSRGYRIQIAKDEDFTMVVADIGGAWAGPFYTPPDLDAPALIIPPGGGNVTDSNGNTWAVPALEADHTYYWRITVQDVATGDAIKSPLSWRESFVVKTSLPVRVPSIGPLISRPANGAGNVPRQPAFSWSTMSGATEYEFVLAGDASMTDVVVKALIPTSAYEFKDELEPGKTYFWKVRATEPVPSDWSAVANFAVVEEPRLAGVSPTKGLPIATMWAWLIVAIGVMLDIGLLILILRRQSA